MNHEHLSLNSEENNLIYKDFSTYKYCEILNILRVGICCADYIHFACFSSIQGLSTVAEKVQAGSAGDCLVVARHAKE